jgi:hypothetical protein
VNANCSYNAKMRHVRHLAFNGTCRQSQQRHLSPTQGAWRLFCIRLAVEEIPSYGLIARPASTAQTWQGKALEVQQLHRSGKLTS